MKIVMFYLVSATCFANGGIFNFTELTGFEKCITADHLIDETKTDKGAEKRYLEPTEIQERCIEQATKVSLAEKDKKVQAEFVRTAKRKTSAELALPLIVALSEVSPVICNEMDAYGILIKLLSYPKSTAPSSIKLLEDTKRAVKQCLKDKQFKADFLEEKDSESSPYLRDNACAILLDEKLVKNCERKSK